MRRMGCAAVRGVHGWGHRRPAYRGIGRVGAGVTWEDVGFADIILLRCGVGGTRRSLVVVVMLFIVHILIVI